MQPTRRTLGDLTLTALRAFIATHIAFAVLAVALAIWT